MEISTILLITFINYLVFVIIDYFVSRSRMNTLKAMDEFLRDNLFSTELIVSMAPSLQRIFDSKLSRAEKNVIEGRRGLNFDEIYRLYRLLNQIDPIKEHSIRYEHFKQVIKDTGMSIRANLRHANLKDVTKAGEVVPKITRLRDIAHLKPIMSLLEELYERIDKAKSNLDIEQKAMLKYKDKVLEKLEQNLELRTVFRSGSSDKVSQMLKKVVEDIDKEEWKQ